jgi:hypothetical protein
MADFISDLASRTGVSTDMARKGMGAILDFCKGKLSPDAYARVSTAVPDADGMIADSTQAAQHASPQPTSGGGMFGGLTGAVGKLFGGGGGGGGGAGGMAEIAGKLMQSGFSIEQARSFLPQALGFLQDKLPPDVMQKLAGMLPAGMLDATGPSTRGAPPT